MSNRSVQAWSQVSQESKSRAQASICAVVDLRGLVDERGQELSLVQARAPQLESEIVPPADLLGQAPQLVDRDPAGVLRVDAVARHAGAILLAAETLDGRDDAGHRVEPFCFDLTSRSSVPAASRSA